MRPHAPSAFRGAPCRHGSPPASSAFAVLVARYFSPLRTFKQRLTAIASRQSASRNRAVSQSRLARSLRRPPAVNCQRANTGCNASHLSRLHPSQPPTARALLPTPAAFAAGSPEPLHSHVLLHSRPPEARSHCRCATTSSPNHRRDRRASDLPAGSNWQKMAKSQPNRAIPCQWVQNRQSACKPYSTRFCGIYLGKRESLKKRLYRFSKPPPSTTRPPLRYDSAVTIADDPMRGKLFVWLTPIGTSKTGQQKQSG